MAITSRVGDSIGRHFDKIFILLLASGLFIYASIKPTFRLRGETPPQFVGTLSPAEDHLVAEGYWDCALIHIQWMYAYGYPLPQEPPPEFTLAKGEHDNAATGSAIRVQYWNRLQTVWSDPGAWKKSYRWDFNWITDWIGPTQSWLNKHLPGLGNGG
jgi:hypothetical protein